MSKRHPHGRVNATATRTATRVSPHRNSSCPVKLPVWRGTARMLAARNAGASVTDPDLAQWRPPLWTAQTALAPDRPVLAARIQDSRMHDRSRSPRISPPILRRTSKPPGRIMPKTRTRCDAGRCLSMGGLLALAFRHRLMDGEALAVILWLPRGGRYATAVQVIDADRPPT